MCSTRARRSVAARFSAACLGVSPDWRGGGSAVTSGFSAVFGLADHLQVGVYPEVGAQALSHHVVVIRDQDA